MKQLRFRTAVLALLVTGASSVIGVGLGRFVTKAVLAGPKPAASTTTTTSRGDQTLRLLGADDDDDNIQVLREIHLGASEVPRNQPDFGDNAELLIGAAATVNPVPLWTYNYTASAARGGGTFTGRIVGRSPFARGKTTTTIPTQIVPLIITINGVTFDPTVVDTVCGPAPRNASAVNIITGSPIFQNTNWTMNGANLGSTQYLDAFQRAQFSTLVSGTPYRLMLAPQVLPAVSLTLTGATFNAASFGGCGTFGVVDINVLDPVVQNLITGPLAGTVNVGTVPIFLTKSVFASVGNPNNLNNCCILGYHSLFNVGPNIQTYSPFSLDISGVIGGDVSTLSHEIGELINDPDVNNITPPWGNIGQTVGFCQGNFETGDPLSPGFGTPTSPFTVVGANGYTYTLQEQAYISWFFGGPAGSANGKYSNHDTFGGEAKPCPPGGTN